MSKGNNCMDHKKYFTRKLVYTNKENKIALIVSFDPPTAQALDPWLGTVVALADGKHTIEQLIGHLSSKYTLGAPGDLQQTIESIVNRLVEADVIQLSSEAQTLPLYLSTPFEKQDYQLSMEQMLKDKHIMDYKMSSTLS